MANKQIQVSVVIPAYKSAEFIERTVDSVVTQEGVDFELIIGMQGPDDGTKDILKKYEHDSRVHIFESPKGAAKENWNFVTSKAKGKYIKLLPGDDIITLDTLRRQYELLESNPGTVLTASRRSVIDENDKVITKSWGLQGFSKPHPIDGRVAIKKAARLGMNPLGEPGSVLMLREALEESGMWDFDNPYVVDLQTYSNVLLLGKFIPDNEIGSKFRISKGQWTNELSDDQADHFVDYIKVFKQKTDGFVSSFDLFVGRLMSHTAQIARKNVYRFRKDNK